MNAKLKAAIVAAKKSIERELGMLFVISILAILGIVIALPIMWALAIMPDWATYMLGASWVIYLLFGDTLSAAARAFREEKP